MKAQLLPVDGVMPYGSGVFLQVLDNSCTLYKKWFATEGEWATAVLLVALSNRVVHSKIYFQIQNWLKMNLVVEFALVGW